jgi:hypothetical protein
MFTLGIKLVALAIKLFGLAIKLFTAHRHGIALTCR